MNYSKKLKDPRWQKMRLEILSRDGFKCLVCGDGNSTLHVHHCYYVSGRDPWEYGQRALKTLCSKCHDAAHIDSETAISSDEFQKWCIVQEVCGEFESLDNWASSENYSGITIGKNQISSTNLILNTCHFLSEDPNRPDSLDGSLTDPQLKSARLALFYEAGMAGVFTDDFVQEMVRKTAELNEAHRAKKAKK